MSKGQKKVTVQIIAESDKKGLYNIQGSDNEDYLVWVGTSKAPPKTGEVAILFPNDKIEGQWNYWKIDEPQQQSSSKSNASKTNSVGSTNDRMSKADWAMKDLVKAENIAYSVGLNNLLPLGVDMVEKGIPLYFSDEKKKKPVVAASLQEFVEWASEISHEMAASRTEYNENFGKDEEAEG